MSRKDPFKPTETIIKNQIKDYLAIQRIFNYPITQGLGSTPGLPDRVFHYKGRAGYIEVKTSKGRLSQYQLGFQEQCHKDGIPYIVARSVTDVAAALEEL